MRNITLSVDEKVLEVLRRYAAEHNSTVNALLRDYLTNLAMREDRAKNARIRLRELSAAALGEWEKQHGSFTTEEMQEARRGVQAQLRTFRTVRRSE